MDTDMSRSNSSHSMSSTISLSTSPSSSSSSSIEFIEEVQILKPLPQKTKRNRKAPSFSSPTRSPNSARSVSPLAISPISASTLSRSESERKEVFLVHITAWFLHLSQPEKNKLTARKLKLRATNLATSLRLRYDDLPPDWVNDLRNNYGLVLHRDKRLERRRERLRKLKMESQMQQNIQLQRLPRSQPRKVRMTSSRPNNEPGPSFAIHRPQPQTSYENKESNAVRKNVSQSTLTSESSDSDSE